MSKAPQEKLTITLGGNNNRGEKIMLSLLGSDEAVKRFYDNFASDKPDAGVFGRILGIVRDGNEEAYIAVNPHSMPNGMGYLSRPFVLIPNSSANIEQLGLELVPGVARTLRHESGILIAGTDKYTAIGPEKLAKKFPNTTPEQVLEQAKQLSLAALVGQGMVDEREALTKAGYNRNHPALREHQTRQVG